ncbi:MAG: M20/M25/M40 family metallo-hydrolase [Pseudomonadota bacterium]
MFWERRACCVRLIPLAAALFLSACAQFDIPSSTTTSGAADALKQHVTVLASDAFEGRETGTDGFALAADYVAGDFAAAGLLPISADDYRQDVPLYKVERASVSGEMTLTVDGSSRPLIAGEDVSFFPPITNLGTSGKQSASGELVFVGYGMTAPALGYDDYDGVDVADKIVIVLSGTPIITDPAARLHLRRLDTKRMTAVRNGAAAVVFADPSPRSVRSLTRLRRSGRHDSLAMETRPDEAVPTAAMSYDLLTRLIDDTGYDGKSLIEGASQGQQASLPLGVTADLTVSASAQRLDAFNVVGVLPGRDPTFQNEAVVVTAHLDHLGTHQLAYFDFREEKRDDNTFNGALDNALGVAVLMEVAERLSVSGRTNRTVIFAAVTAEEFGLLGSQHLAETIDMLGYKPVANVNIDMPVMTYPLTDVIGFGVEHSSLKEPLDAAAAGVGVVATPDPVPSMSLFVRSDHYRFVQRGIPSVFLFNGMTGDEGQGFQAFMDEHYHQPSDDVHLPIRWHDAARFTDLAEDLIRRIADAPEAPTWNEGAVFAP